MKPAALFLALSGAGVVFGLGIAVGRRSVPGPVEVTTTAREGGGDASAAPGSARDAGIRQPPGPAGAPAGASSAKVTALLAGFDGGKRVASQSAVLLKILEASAADLAEMTKAMSGPAWSGPAWSHTRSAVMQRWVELAPGEAIAWARGALRDSDTSSQAAEVFGILAALDPEQAMAEAGRIAEPRLKDQAIHSVIEAVGQSDPERAVRLGHGLAEGHQWQQFPNLFAIWIERDPTAATVALASLESPNVREHAATWLIDRWAVQDPSSALAWAKGLSDADLRRVSLRTYFGTVGQRDPEAAIAQISDLPRTQQRGLLGTVVDGWIRTDADAATAWLLARPDALERQQLIKSAIGHPSNLSGEQSARLVSELTPGTAREQALKRLIGNWASSDPDAAIAYMGTLPADEQGKLHGEVVQGLAGQDPEKALAYLRENPIDDPASKVWRELGMSLADQGRSAEALEWAKALPDEVSQRKALAGILLQIAEQDPAEAARQLALLPDGPARIESLSTVADAWAGANLDDALAWARGLAGAERETAMAVVLAKGAPYQPKMAAGQFESVLAGMEAGTRPADGLLNAAGRIAAAYLAEDQQAAARWAANLPQDAARAAAVSSLAESWVEEDPPGASEWIGTLPDGKARDAAVHQLVGEIASTDPASAFAWASSVNDATERSNLLQTTFASWRRLDPPAARLAIEAADWPEPEKAKWLEEVK